MHIQGVPPRLLDPAHNRRWGLLGCPASGVGSIRRCLRMIIEFCSARTVAYRDASTPGQGADVTMRVRAESSLRGTQDNRPLPESPVDGVSREHCLSETQRSLQWHHP